MTELTVETDAKTTSVDITDRVAETIPADVDGVCTVFVRHTTAGVIVNENERRLREDLANALEALVPDEGWSHDALDGNADSHVRAMLLGEHVTVPVQNGKLGLGRWQSILFMECDGPRTRTVDVVVH
ncbi:secondary thiamine-phosphate synthase enzyme [Halohasta litchfieldiae]|jgi:secondary thiamine-phosphate synthase enzyme|uniref:Secondary thiamine-phosphate synthase enzyme n=1 Tax=Halohasta litchfieldiae TaxID=1073996 RepID=A0A1H6VK79_9EURY|nr:secondary thiamine-phosphate synthase enzyme YjbQ [Halohasta litchfieldiae]ATW88951.1 secondary thiamine-phosphate synthase enzyme [Halohasta litchfieldiae]SEJ01160.1 secondary thiamine-phosphate synthase enzyme [Halohasta litchfieldiae]